MSDRLLIPATACLIAFRRVAEARSVTLAAAGLGLTQGAVSKQIKALERFLGARLFSRAAEGLALTPEGARYLAEIAPALDGLARAGRRLTRRGEASAPVRIRGLAALSDRWLLPRFGRFVAAHPEVGVEVSTLLFEVTRPLAPAHVEIRYGEGDWPGCESRYLIGAECALIVAPSFFARMRPDGAMTAGDALGWPRLAHLQAPHIWREYHALHGPPEAPAPGEPQSFELYSVLISAAMNGFGAALAPRCLIATELAASTLLNPQGLGLRSRLGYHLCWPRAEALSPGAATLVDWLLAEARLTEP